MNERVRRIRAVFEFEFDVSFPFPVAEALSIVLGALVAMSVVMMQTSYATFLVTPSEWANSIQLEDLDLHVIHADFYLLIATFSDLTVLLIIALPMLCAFRVAGPLENGVLKAMLSYPIRRKELLILKGIEIMVLVCLPITMGALAIIVLYNGLSVGIESLLTIISFWTLAFAILSSSFLLSVIAQSSAKAAFSGVALWAVLFLFSGFSKAPFLFRGIANPVGLTISYFTGYPDIVFLDVLGAIIGNLLIGIITFVASIKYFRRVEI